MKPAISVGKKIVRFVDAENAEIISFKMAYHLSHLLKVLPMKKQYNVSLKNSLVCNDFCLVLVGPICLGLDRPDNSVS